MDVPFRVFPSRGYLNTKYQVVSYSDVDVTVSVSIDGHYECAVRLDKDVEVLQQFKKAGKYTFKFGRYKQEVIVEDAYRYGGSVEKKCYIFDDSSICFIVMKDRMYVHDISTNKTIEENFIIPDDVFYISENFFLFKFIYNGQVSFNIYSIVSYDVVNAITNEKNIFPELTDKAPIKDHVLYTYHNVNKDKCIINKYIIENGKFNRQKRYRDVIKYKLHNGYIIIISSNNIIMIDIETYKEKEYTTERKLVITENLYLIGLNVYSKYYAINMVSDERFDFDYNIQCDKIRYSGFMCILSEEIYTKNTGRTYNIAFYPFDKSVYILSKIENVKYIYNKSDIYEPPEEYRTSSYRLIFINDDIKKTLKEYKSINYIYCMNDTLIVDNEVYVNGEYSLRADKKPIHIDMSKQGESSVNSCGFCYDIRAESLSSNKRIIKINNEYKVQISIKNKFELKSIIRVNDDRYDLYPQLSPDGNHLIRSKINSNQYEYYNIITGEVEYFSNDRFFGFDERNNLMFYDLNSNGDYRNLRLIDNTTFQPIPSGFYKYYVFGSSDGKLYGSITPHKKYYFNKLDNKEISYKEYEILEKTYDNYFSESHKKIVLLSKNELYKKHKYYFDKIFKEGRFKEFKDSKDSSKLDKCIDEICTFDFIEIRCYATIGISNSSNKIDIYIGDRVRFINYISFSSDNRYVGIVGKMLHNKNYNCEPGFIRIAEVKYDENLQTLQFVDSKYYKESRKAVWVGLFSNNLFAAYDSNPRTYIIDCNKMSELQNLKERNILGFSKSGKYMAMSEQGYTPSLIINDCFIEGHHWLSSNVYIYATSKDFKELFKFDDNGDGICQRTRVEYKEQRTISSVMFSDDDRRIMTVNNNGVIVVRNLHLPE